MIVAELALLTERHGETSKEVKMRHQYSGKFFVKRENKNQNHQHSNLHHLYIAEILTKLRAIYDATVWKGIVARFKISDRPFLECPTRLYGTLRERFSRDQMTQQVIYDATLWKAMAAGSKISDRDRFYEQTASIYVQEGFVVSAAVELVETQPNGQERESIGDMPTARWRDTAFLECPTGLYATLRDRFIHDAITQQPQSIYDATRWKSITPGFRNQTQKSRFIYDAMVWASISMGDGISPHLMLSMTGQHRAGYSIYDAMS